VDHDIAMPLQWHTQASQIHAYRAQHAPMQSGVPCNNTIVSGSVDADTYADFIEAVPFLTRKVT
jgi:hypothetical protein